MNAGKLSPAELEFVELAAGCGLPEITGKDLVDRFLAQSAIAEQAKQDLFETRKELELLRSLRASFTQMIAQSLRGYVEAVPAAAPASPPRLALVPREGA